MPRGRTYELKAVFSAENKAGRTIAALERRLESLQNKVDKLSRQDADIGISEHGAAETASRIDNLQRKVKQFDGMDAEATVGVSEAEMKRSHKQLADLDRRINKLTSRPNTIDLDVDAATAERRIREVGAEARELSRRAYHLELIAEARNMPEVMAQAQRLKEVADNVNGQRMQLIADIKNVPQVLRDAGLMKIALNEVEGTYHVKIDYRSMATARGAIMGVGAVLKGLGSTLQRMQPLSQSFAQKVYIMQQAMSVFRVAIMAVAVAAAGPLVAGLTILGSSLLALAGGFGLVAMAAAPIISYFANARQRVHDLEQAQTGLDSAQEQAASSAQAVADAQRGVGEAYRTGQEQIKAAIDAHRDSVIAVQDAQRGYADAQQTAEDATRDVAMATKEYNTALATEQFRLRSMNLDIKGMRLSQQQLTLDMRDARREVEKAENPRERKEAMLRLQQLQLQQKQGTMDITMAQKELNQAQKQGTDELQSAQDARKQAMESQKDAQQGVVDALRQVASAQRDERQAEKGISKARQDAARQMADANRTLLEAVKAQAQAQQDVKEKQKALNVLLGKQPRHLQKIQHAVNAFKNEYQDSFQQAQISTARLATRIINLGTRNLPQLGRTANRTAQGLNKAFSNIARNFRKFGVLESVQRILKTMPNITKNWTQAIGNFGGAFLNIMGEAMPFARRMAKAVKDISRDFLEWTDSEKGRQQIRRFFKSAAPVAKALWEQIKRIGGALLRWTTQSKQGPERVAKAIKTMGDIVMGTVHMVRRLINVWNALPKPIRRVIVTVGLLWMGLRLLFGSRMLMGLAKLGFRLVQIGAAAYKGSRLAALALGPQGLILAAVALTIVGAVKMFNYLKNDFFPTWSRGIKQATGKNSLGGAIKYAILHPLQPVPMDVRKKIEESLKTAPGIIGQAFRLGTAIRNALIEGISRFIPGVENTLKKAYGITDKGTKKMADVGSKNTKQGSENIKSAYNSAKNNVSDSTRSMSNSTKNMSGDVKNDMQDIKNVMIKQSEEAEKTGSQNFKDFQSEGTNQMKDLFNNTDFNMGKMKSASNDYTEKMKNTGIANFEDFNLGGKDETEDLKVQSSAKMLKMQSMVNKYTHTTMEKGVKDLVDMQERGTGAMSDAQESWVSKAWATAVQTQDSFNAILEGIGRFIDKADIDMKKPEKFSVIYRKGGDISGGPNDPGLTPNQRRLATGGIMKYAAGGVQGPEGGVAQGTTRVYGEVPGTTEFYITDNKKHRKRNMEILQAANQHMNLAGGGVIMHDERTGVYRQGGDVIEAASVPRGKINLTHGDHKLGMHGPMAGRALRASRAWRAPSVFEKGRDARVFRKAGVGSGRTSSAGTISVDPGFRGPVLNAILVHEEGHALGMGHSSSGIMRPTIGASARPSSREIRWVHQNYEQRVGGGSGGGHGGRGHGGRDGGGSGRQDRRESKRDARRAEHQERRKIGKENKQARRAARKFRRSFNRNRSNYGPLGQPPDYSRNALWMARGGVHIPPMTAKMADMKLDAIAKAHQQHGPERDDLQHKGWERKGSEIIEYLGRTTHNWKEPAKSIQADTVRHVKGITTNTYVGHPGGEGNSVDHWGPGGRGANIGKSKGNEVERYILDKWKEKMEYYIWQGIITGWGRSRKYNDPGDMHFDHLHATYPGGTPNLGGAGGRGGAVGGGPSEEDINKWWEDTVPTMPNNLGYGILGEAASMAGSKVREAAKEYYMSKVPTGSGSGGGFSGPSPKGLTANEVMDKAGFSQAQHANAVGVAWEESGFNAGNNVNRYKGLFAMGPEAFQEVGMSYSKWHDPIYNATAAMKLQKKMGWAQPWDAWPVSASSKRRGNQKITGYSHGGVVTRPHMGLIGDTGPEVNLPLHDPRALSMMRRAFDMSERVSGGAMRRNRAIGEAIGSGRRVDQGTGRQRDGSIEQALNKATKKADDAIERAIEKMGNRLDDRIKELIQKEMDLSDANAEKFMRAGMKMMMELLQHPRIGGDIVNEHIVRDVDFERELTKK